MTIRADLAAYNRKNELVLTVEAKTKKNATKEWATRLRRNILAHGSFPRSKFFLLALPDRFFLWKDAGVKPSMSEPSYVIDAYPILSPFYEHASVTPDTISGPSFELLIATWLSELVHSKISSNSISEAEKWVIDSGLYDALTGGYLEYEVAA